MNKTMAVLALALALASTATSQTKISGTTKCGKPEQAQKIDIPDAANHAYTISQSKCEWSKPVEIAGLKSKQDVVTGFAEVMGGSARAHSFVVGTMENGDKFRVRGQGKDTLKDGMVQSSEGTWTFAGGTGKLKGIKGQGTYKGTGGEDGMTIEVEGEYELPK